MKVTVLKGFYDLKERVSRVAGEVFDATQARIDEIKGVDDSLIKVEKPKRKAPAPAKEAEQAEAAEEE